jgi:D-lactate dehydrogenase (cytochrome)
LLGGAAITEYVSFIYFKQRKEGFGGPNEVRQAINELRQLFPEDSVLTGEEIVRTYGSSDNSYHPSSPHAVIILPSSTEDVVKVVNVARKWRIPIVPYSGATSLEGHFSGVSIDPHQFIIRN